MPLIGLGTWQAPKGEVGAAVKTALEVGYRHIDCAACYGNEDEVGEALADVFASGKVKRNEVFITSKLWNSEHDPKYVKSACEMWVLHRTHRIYAFLRVCSSCLRAP